MTTLLEAAERRAAGVRAPADRPSQRRASEHGGANVTRAAQSLMEIREADTGAGLSFTGIASVYDRGYEMWDAFGPYVEYVDAGAGRESMSRSDLSVPLVLDHDPMRRIALTDNGSLILSETERGLEVHAPNLDPLDHDVAYIAPKMRSGLITEMSVRFRITRGVWNDDYTEYRIQSYDIHRGDVAIVGYGANPYTSSTMRESSASHSRKPRGIDLIGEYDTAHRR